ncbi:integrase (plasmid) [Pandoraea faecigallinarum]|uniref:Integrase n=1 Tax=Pandoraea faecigallinarum TaxID=656179 RepID=A0A0H3WYI8_9BURK|nr:IS21 family transposase [Pandoraea faecigallinarum]AKM33224.1 integrase [Pandoraea faecigallinarum]
MKQDGEIRLLLEERRKGTSQKLAAARTGMSERTGRKYERAGKLPSQMKTPRTHRTRTNPFLTDWPWVQAQLQRDPALQAKTLFVLLCEAYPGRYRENQLRTLQRHVQAWRAQSGPEREIMFPQEHVPGRMAQSDFTEMNSLGVTIAGAPFEHLVYHLVLTYSNVEAIRIGFSESFESLAEGLEACLWQIGGVPQWHRTDNLTAAVRDLDRDGRHEFTANYGGLLNHYGMQPSANTAGCANQNGDVEQPHFRFKTAVDQALRVRGSREFDDRTAYERFLSDLVRSRNLTRTLRFEADRAALRPLPAAPLDFTRELTVRVSRFRLIRVLNNHYSVPSRLNGASLKVRVRSETLELHHGTAHVLTLPRLIGRNQRRIDYRHLIWSLVRKPGAFVNYCYREELFPTTVFRRAYDALLEGKPAGADKEYLRLLHLAASTSEAEVECAIGLLVDQQQLPTFDAVRELIVKTTPTQAPAIDKGVIDLSGYDRLIPSRSQHGQCAR